MNSFLRSLWWAIPSGVFWINCGANYALSTSKHETRHVVFGSNRSEDSWFRKNVTYPDEITTTTQIRSYKLNNPFKRMSTDDLQVK